MNHKMQSDTAADDEIDLSQLLETIWQGRLTIVLSSALCGAVALAVALSLPSEFTARSSVMPPQQQSSGLAAALGSLGALAGVAGASGLKNPNDLYVGILKSQNVSDSLIKRFELKARYEVNTFVDARSALAAAADIQSAKSGLIEIAVKDTDPVFAAKLANAYVDELKRVNQSMAVTDAAKRRLFFEKQLQDVRADLNVAESRLEQFQKKSGLILPEGQVSGLLKAVAELKAMIAAKEVQLTTMRSFATDKNADVVRVQGELTALRAQLQQLSAAGGDEAGLMPGAAKLPEKGLGYIRALREVKYQEALLEIMAKQYELARMEEARDSSLIQVLDVATPPDRKSGPKRSMIVLAGLMVGTMLGTALVFIRRWRQGGFA
ncbi:MAG: GumC family protein [Vogesella sp.]|uniref:GumC family protein n=1 Tax=Vogesella sp. TaxID=1904252 RepID=UPI003918BD2D